MTIAQVTQEAGSPVGLDEPTRAQTAAIFGRATKGTTVAREAKAAVQQQLTAALADGRLATWAQERVDTDPFWRWMITDIEHESAADRQRAVIDRAVTSYVDAWAKNAAWVARAAALQVVVGERAATPFTFHSAEDVARRQLRSATETLTAERPFVEAFVDEVHTQTQRHLQATGIDTITVYRGERAAEVPTGPTTLRLNPLCSWSTSLTEARRFTEAGWHHGHFGEPVIYAMRVPASRVWSTPRTGPGCLAEHELILTGGHPDQVSIYSGDALA